MTGVILANPSIDYQVHNSLFLVAHFHNMLIPGTLFGMLGAHHFWFPKAFGVRLDELWGRVSACCWIGGFMFAFFPLYGLGLLGMTRRAVTYSKPVYQLFTIVALVSAAVLAFALFVQLWVSVRDRANNRVPAGDPWDGRSLEWLMTAPPPEYNFAVLPTVTSRDASAAAKDSGLAYWEPDRYETIEMPKNSALGIALAALGSLVAFGLVWHIGWLVVVGLVLVVVVTIARGFVRDTTHMIPALQVLREHRYWLAQVATLPAVEREREVEPVNHGLAHHALASGGTA